MQFWDDVNQRLSELIVRAPKQLVRGGEVDHVFTRKRKALVQIGTDGLNAIKGSHRPFCQPPTRSM
ncbi:hypothetical protein AC480_02530 [miscellaneous Crenarchaeota group archaeon SMTZ1-55]|nr:MAG: hypothetical protein AC480_02530 [miscellaneous Crenarchaeota group archaeon SMTZ1-55]